MRDVPVGFCTFDLKFRYLFVNEWLAALNGLSAEDHLGRTIHQVIPHVAAGVEAQLRQVIDTGEPIVGGKVEAETPAYPGEKRAFQHTYTAIKDRDDTVIGVSCLVSDISDQFQAESAVRDNVAALRESEERLNLALEAASIGCWSWNVVDDSHFWDARMLRISGMEPDIATGLMADDFLRSLHPGDKDRVLEAVRRSLEDGAEYDIKYRIIRRDNSEVRDVNARASVIRDDAGKPIRMTGVAIDISEQIRVQSELRQARDRLEMRVGEITAALDNMPSHISLYDSEDRLVYQNDVARQLRMDLYGRDFIGATFEEFCRAGLALGVAPEAKGREEDWLRERLRQHRNPSSAFRLQGRGGRPESWHEVREHRTPDGGTLTIWVDVSEFVAQEQQLRQAQKMEAVGQLTGGIAHDFNNILTIIMGNMEILGQRGAIDSGERNLAEAIERATQRGADLTDRLLTFSRKQTLSPELTDIRMIVPHFKQLAGQTLGEDIDIEAKYSTGLWLVDVDQGQLENALLNLAINARHAIPKGGRLRIEAFNRVLDHADTAHLEDLSPGDYVLITVSDTGAGMSADTVSRAFEPFFYHQGRGRGQRTGAQHGDRLRRAIRRLCQHRKRAGERVRGYHLSAEIGWRCGDSGSRVRRRWSHSHR